MISPKSVWRLSLALAGCSLLASGTRAQEPAGQAYPPPIPQTSAEPIPLPQESPQDGQAVDAETFYWFWPRVWVQDVDWDGSVEVGINGTDGNAEALSLRAGANLKRKTKTHEIAADTTYLKTQSRGIETQHSALFNAGYERFLGESPWTYFVKCAIEYDEFKAFDVRLAFNAGVGYQFIRSDDMKLKGRLGTGVSHEVGGPDDAWEPEAVFGGDYEWKITSRQKLIAKVDYFPQWDDFNDFRLVSGASWQVVLDEVANLSLKLSVNDRYDSTPNGRRPNDIDYALLLLWKI